MTKLKQFLSIPFFIVFLFISNNVFATNYFVSNNGNDLNSGTTISTAFLTIQHASDIVASGDTVFVENGIYAGFDHRSTSGTMTMPIVFKAMGNSVLINIPGPIRDDGINVEDADYIVIDGFICNDLGGAGNGIRIVLADNCIVRNCSCDNNGERGIFTAFTDDILIEHNICTNSNDEHGIYVSNSSDRPIIRYNECYGNNNIGIHMNGDLSSGGDGIISDAQVYGNILHDNNLAAGINMDGVVNAQVYNNLIYNNHSAQGIALFQEDGAVPTSGIKIYNNTIIVPSDGRWGILVQNGSNVNTEIFNNIIINQHAWRGCIAISNSTGFSSNYNIVNDKLSDNGDGSTITFAQWQALGFDLNSQLANPLTSIFVDPNNNDFHLSNSSQAINTGTNSVSTVVTDDLDLVSRPQGAFYDIGSYEDQGPLSISMEAPFIGQFLYDKVQLSWSVKEKYNNHFEIFRSNNSKYWDRIAKIESQGELDHSITYRHVDRDMNNGVNYYKLDAIDEDGFTETLGIIIVNCPIENDINIYPNPVEEILFVKNDNGEIIYQIYNGQNQLLLSGKYSKGGINIEKLNKGHYTIMLNNGKKQSVKKFVRL